MKNTKSTKRALLSAILALVMTVSMLVGTTFAWFTDSVTSSNNIITAGNLDISLEYYNGSGWVDVSGSSEILDKDAKWEPGYTEVIYLKIENEGSLDLKYQLGVNIVDEIVGVNVAGDPLRLSDYIYYDTLVMTDFVPFDDRADAMAIATETKKISEAYSKSGVLEADSDPVYVAMVVYMPATVGNEANHNGVSIPEIVLGIDIVATQLASEDDSFGKDYDEDAVYPDKKTVNVPVGEASSVKAGGVTANIPASSEAANYTLEISNTSSETKDGVTTVDLDISLLKNGKKIEADGATKYALSVEIEKNLDVTSVTHNGEEIFFHYEPMTGVITFEVDSFSPFSYTYSEADGETVYNPSSEAAAAELEKANVVAVDENGNGYASLTAAVKSGAKKLYLKAGADLGTITHLDVAGDLTIYGNGAYISGGERDFAIDTYAKLTNDITVTVYNLHGVAFWGQRNTSYTANLNLYNCNNISRVYLNGTSGVNNIALYNCTASKGNDEAYKNIIGDTAIYSNANGSIVVDGCTFENIGCPINLNHKVAGEQKVTVINSDFVNCATEGTAAYYAPIRLYNSAEGANHTLTVAGNTFTYDEGKAPINNADVLLNAKHNDVDAIGDIVASVQISATVACGEKVTLTNAIYTAEDLYFLANEVNKVEEFEKNSFDGKTVVLMNDIDLGGAEWSPIGNFGNSSKQFTGTFDGQGRVISNFKITQKSPDRVGKDRSPHGFFGNVNGTIKNLTIDGAVLDVKNAKWAGALVGRLNGGSIENCHVTNSSVTFYNWQVGGLVGQMYAAKISNCSVTNSDVNGYAQLGGLVGVVLGGGEHVIENCVVEDTEINQNGSFGSNYDKMIGGILGATYSGTATVIINNCKAVNNNNNIICGYTEEGDKLVVDDLMIVDKPITVAAATLTEDFLFPAGTNAVIYKDMILVGDAQITHSENAGLGLSNVSAELDHDVIIRKSAGAIFISDCDFTLTDGAKLISVAEGGDGYQVFMVNVTINGVKMDSTTIWNYVEGVEYISIVSL